MGWQRALPAWHNSLLYTHPAAEVKINVHRGTNQTTSGQAAEMRKCGGAEVRRSGDAPWDGRRFSNHHGDMGMECGGWGMAMGMEWNAAGITSELEGGVILAGYEVGERIIPTVGVYLHWH